MVEVTLPPAAVTVILRLVVLSVAVIVGNVGIVLAGMFTCGSKIACAPVAYAKASEVYSFVTVPPEYENSATNESPVLPDFNLPMSKPMLKPSSPRS